VSPQTKIDGIFGGPARSAETLWGHEPALLPMGTWVEGPGADGAGVYDNTNSGIYINAGKGADGLIQYRFRP
jgi:hypothetical protein